MVQAKDLQFVSRTFAPGSRGQILAERLVSAPPGRSDLAMLAGAAVHGMDPFGNSGGYRAETGVTIFLTACEAVGYGPAIESCSQTLLKNGFGKFTPKIDIVDPGTTLPHVGVVAPAQAEAQDKRLQRLAAVQGPGIMAYVFDEYVSSRHTLRRGAEIVGRAFPKTAQLAICRSIYDKDYWTGGGDYIHDDERPMSRQPSDLTVVNNPNSEGVQALTHDMTAIGAAAAENLLAYCHDHPRQLGYFVPRTTSTDMPASALLRPL